MIDNESVKEGREREIKQEGRGEDLRASLGNVCVGFECRWTINTIRSRP